MLGLALFTPIVVHVQHVHTHQHQKAPELVIGKRYSQDCLP
jgi:hypothetical protein